MVVVMVVMVMVRRERTRMDKRIRTEKDDGNIKNTLKKALVMIIIVIIKVVTIIIKVIKVTRVTINTTVIITVIDHTLGEMCRLPRALGAEAA